MQRTSISGTGQRTLERKEWLTKLPKPSRLFVRTLHGRRGDEAVRPLEKGGERHCNHRFTRHRSLQRPPAPNSILLYPSPGRKPNTLHVRDTLRYNTLPQRSPSVELAVDRAGKSAIAIVTEGKSGATAMLQQEKRRRLVVGKAGTSRWGARARRHAAIAGRRTKTPKKNLKMRSSAYLGYKNRL